VLHLSGGCKMAANKRIPTSSLFPVFQEICPGCCTVAARPLCPTAGFDDTTPLDSIEAWVRTR
jgi:hypothetical protein